MATSTDRGLVRIEDPRALLVGDSRRWTAGALGLAVGLFATSAAVDYLALQAVTGRQPGFHLAADLAHVFAMGSPAGYLLVIGIAAGHAALNRGYLPTLVLASALRFGDAVFYVADARALQEETVELGDATVAAGFRPYFLTSHPPEVLIYPTLGFALGLLVRRVRRGRDANGESRPQERVRRNRFAAPTLREG
ncbi:hypothetical protein C475_16661 [Halosimplex carlsbadense 2-9-1]|uniref:Uncharacterized protein n=1 Tax=Halosimplex carlsbadense 2-9-1 TaxID=797114 RepID=M0CK54_9EURY|nr:hypothetical protein [Halosimplex carlsbadense]ELZ22752.1 hypothetical protein C475_16661 [Halosimplex carlsbadense 2-9-1]